MHCNLAKLNINSWSIASARGVVIVDFFTISHFSLYIQSIIISRQEDAHKLRAGVVVTHSSLQPPPLCCSCLLNRVSIVVFVCICLLPNASEFVVAPQIVIEKSSSKMQSKIFESLPITTASQFRDELCLEFPEKIPVSGDTLITVYNKPVIKLKKVVVPSTQFVANLNSLPLFRLYVVTAKANFLILVQNFVLLP